MLLKPIAVPFSSGYRHQPDPRFDTGRGWDQRVRGFIEKRGAVWLKHSGILYMQLLLM